MFQPRNGVCGKVDAEINVCCVLTPGVFSQRQGSSAVSPPVESTAPEAQEPDAEVERGMRAPPSTEGSVGTCCR